MPRFKIDFYDSWSRHFALYHANPKWHAAVTGAVAWYRIASFENRDEALAFYEKIKDLPQYLD